MKRFAAKNKLILGLGAGALLFLVLITAFAAVPSGYQSGTIGESHGAINSSTQALLVDVSGGSGNVGYFYFQ